MFRFAFFSCWSSDIAYDNIYEWPNPVCWTSYIRAKMHLTSIDNSKQINKVRCDQVLTFRPFAGHYRLAHFNWKIMMKHRNEGWIFFWNNFLSHFKETQKIFTTKALDCNHSHSIQTIENISTTNFIAMTFFISENEK